MSEVQIIQKAIESGVAYQFGRIDADELFTRQTMLLQLAQHYFEGDKFLRLAGRIEHHMGEL